METRPTTHLAVHSIVTPTKRIRPNGTHRQNMSHHRTVTSSIRLLLDWCATQTVGGGQRSISERQHWEVQRQARGIDVTLCYTLVTLSTPLLSLFDGNSGQTRLRDNSGSFRSPQTGTSS